MAVQRVCTVVKEEFLPNGFLCYLPDTNFVMCSYAVNRNDSNTVLQLNRSVVAIPAQTAQARTAAFS